MKKIPVFGLFLLAIISSVQVFAQRKLTEATVSYDIVINTANTKPQAADALDGSISVIYLKGKSSRSEMITPLGNQSTIIDGKTGNATVLREWGAQKYMITMTPDNWKEYNKKYEKITFTYLNEFKTIAGYNCQKAIGNLNDSAKTTFTVFFTKELVPLNTDFQYLNRNLPGLAMEYEVVKDKDVHTYTVSKISFDPVPAAKLEIPRSGFRVMTYEETKTKQPAN
jgi:GLPGLI family protein